MVHHSHFRKNLAFPSCSKGLRKDMKFNAKSWSFKIKKKSAQKISLDSYMSQRPDPCNPRNKHNNCLKSVMKTKFTKPVLIVFEFHRTAHCLSTKKLEIIHLRGLNPSFNPSTWSELQKIYQYIYTHAFFYFYIPSCIHSLKNSTLASSSLDENLSGNDIQFQFNKS